MIIKEPGLLNQLSEMLYDECFEDDDISFDSNSMVFTVTFYRESVKKRKLISKTFFLKKYRVPFYKRELHVMNAVSYSIKNHRKADLYVLHCIEYDDDEKTVSIIASNPIIEVKVTDLEIRLEDSDEICFEREKFSIF